MNRTMKVPAGEAMIGELLRKSGYRTFHLGKWHLGETPESRPEARGFDENELRLRHGLGSNEYLRTRFP